MSDSPVSDSPVSDSPVGGGTTASAAPGRRRQRSPFASGDRLRSIAADDLPADELLYDDDGIVVMPSWLEIGRRESYAVRSIVRLSLDESAPPRGTATAFSLVGILLAIGAGLHVVRATLPFVIAWSALAASLALALYAGFHAFVRPSVYRLDVTLNDGTRIPLERADRASLLMLHRALARAMERQRGGG